MFSEDAVLPLAVLLLLWPALCAGLAAACACPAWKLALDLSTDLSTFRKIRKISPDLTDKIPDLTGKIPDLTDGKTGLDRHCKPDLTDKKCSAARGWRGFADSLTRARLLTFFNFLLTSFNRPARSPPRHAAGPPPCASAHAPCFAGVELTGKGVRFAHGHFRAGGYRPPHPRKRPRLRRGQTALDWRPAGRQSNSPPKRRCGRHRAEADDSKPAGKPKDFPFQEARQGETRQASRKPKDFPSKGQGRGHAAGRGWPVFSQPPKPAPGKALAQARPAVFHSFCGQPAVVATGVVFQCPGGKP